MKLSVLKNHSVGGLRGKRGPSVVLEPTLAPLAAVGRHSENGSSTLEETLRESALKARTWAEASGTTSHDARLLLTLPAPQSSSLSLLVVSHFPTNLLGKELMVLFKGSW